MKKTEIYILSGFLGSGKTTLLRQLLQQEREDNRLVGVIMNEAGTISIDSHEVPEGTPLKELLDGCVCCSLQGKFENQLQELLETYQLDAIYIETTGVAHPVEVLDSCLSPVFADKLSIRGIITVFDAVRWQERDRMNNKMQKLMIEQLRHADLIIVNKTEGLSEASLATLLFEIQPFNPKANWLLSSVLSINPADVRRMNFSKKESHLKSDIHKDLHIKTFVYTFKNPVQIEVFESWLETIPDNVYRIKGFLQFIDSPLPVAFQYAYGGPIYFPTENNAVPLTLVFIGDELDHQTIYDQLQQMEGIPNSN